MSTNQLPSTCRFARLRAMLVGSWLLVMVAAASGQDVTFPSAEALRRDTLDFVESLRVKEAGTPYGVYRMEPGRGPDIYATCNAALIRYIVGDLQLTPRQRQEWIDYINSYQEAKTGKYPAERYLHVFGTAVRALNALGGQPKHPVAFQQEWDDVEYTKKWMARLSWDSPWEPSIKILHVAAPRGAAKAATQPADVRSRQWLSRALDWLDSHQDPQSGLWGTDRGSPPLDGIAAAFHFLPLYEAADRPIRHGPQIVDRIIGFQKSKRGTWGGVYADMDAVSLLVYFYSRDSYRHTDIEHAIRASIELLFKTAYKPKSGSFGDLGNTLGACEHIAEAARVLKDHPYAAVEWHRAWDWRLWRCEW